MLKLDIHQIQKHLKEKSISAELQKETNQLVIVLKIAEREFPLFIRIFEGGELLQLLAFLPCTIIPKALGDTARLLHLLNKEIDVPGFGMDETASLAFYRCMIPAKDQQIDEGIFDALLNAAQVVCTSFAAVVAAVALGTITFDEVLKQSKEHSGKSLSESQIKRK